MTILLAIDTATEVMHLGLAAGGTVHVRAEAGGARASAAVLPVVQALLREAGVSLRDVDAFAFGRGPGAFTGIRTACSVVQGLALGCGRPVIALDSLLAVAEAGRRGLRADVNAPSPRPSPAGAGEGVRLWAATDARMGEVYAACYAFAAGGWRTVEAPALHAPQVLAQRLAERPLPVAGSAAAVFREVLAPHALALWPDAVPDGAALVALAQAAFARGELLDAAQALPLYVRDKVAQTTVERERARLGVGAAPAPAAPSGQGVEGAERAERAEGTGRTEPLQGAAR